MDLQLVHSLFRDRVVSAFCIVLLGLVLSGGAAWGEELDLNDLIQEAMKGNHDILVTEARIMASEYKVPQATSLPDPMFMFGYQNEGFDRYTYGEMEGAQWMFSASQMIPFPGKRALRGEMARGDTESLRATLDAVRLKVRSRVKELYHDLALAYKNIDIIKDRASLLTKVEDAALSRYSSGMGTQQEVLMAQAEKYMLIEKEEMQKQRLQSLEAMLNSTIGRDARYPLGTPSPPAATSYLYSLDELYSYVFENSPEVRSKEKMITVARTKVAMAEREYYPDFTLNASYFMRRWDYLDMWNLTTAVNIPLFYKTKQRQAVSEANASLEEARHEFEATKYMISAAIRDNHSMVRTAERLMDLYKNGLIPKTYQDFDAAIAGYTAGKIEAVTVITRLRTLLDYELLYWTQFAEREKAIARLEAITGIVATGPGKDVTK